MKLNNNCCVIIDEAGIVLAVGAHGGEIDVVLEECFSEMRQAL